MITTLKEMTARIRAFFRARELDDEFAQELESHLAMLVEDNVRRGMAPAEARRAALVRLGAPASIQEHHRAVRGLPALDAALQDLRFAFRLIARDRAFSAAAIVVLALGIGANAIGFTIVNAAFLRGLPFDDSDRLHVVSMEGRSGSRASFSYEEFWYWRAESRTFAGLAAFSNTTLNISDERALPEEARGTLISATAFDVLRQQPLVGRNFGPHDERPGAEPVAILSHRVWKDRYGGDGAVVGKLLRLNGRPVTIVGVMPEGMNFPNNTEVWAPLIPTEAQRARNVRPLHMFGRLRDGASRADAQAEANGIAQQLAAAYPDTNKELTRVNVQTFTERYVGGPARIVFLVMMAAVTFVLLIACANVASLVLSRSADRARELAVRIALGATRWRIVRQLLLESVVLGCFGGIIGIFLASWGVQLLDRAVQDPGKPYWIAFTVDYVVIGYVAAICVLTGILFGLAPALQVSNTDVNHVLKEGGRGAAGNRRLRWLSATMVVAELSLTIVLLTGAGLMIRSFLKLYTLDVGIRTDHLMAMRMRLPESKYATTEARRAFFDRLEPLLASIPGVERVALTTAVPPFDSDYGLLELEGRSIGNPDEPGVSAAIVTTSPAFFDAVGVSLVRGRNFRETDGARGSEAVVINERMAARAFPGENPIGRRIRFAQHNLATGELPNPWLTIVGVSPTIRHGRTTRIGGGGLNAVVYVPYRQEAPTAMSLLVRSQLPPESVMKGVREVVRSVDQDQPVYTVQTLDQMLAQDRWPSRVFGGLFAAFALIALVLSSVGLYGVMAYAVTQRTQEIGVRMALGGEARHVRWLILRRGLAQVAIGLTLGLGGAFGLSQVLRTVVVQISPTDPVTYATMTILLTTVALAACLVPARRATRVDPIVALRVE